jgi:hypothetical protein
MECKKSIEGGFINGSRERIMKMKVGLIESTGGSDGTEVAPNQLENVHCVWKEE